MVDFIDIDKLKEALNLQAFVTKEELNDALAKVNFPNVSDNDKSSEIERLRSQIKEQGEQFDALKREKSQLEEERNKSRAEFDSLKAEFDSEKKGLEESLKAEFDSEKKGLEESLKRMENLLRIEKNENAKLNEKNSELSKKLKDVDLLSLYQKISDEDVKYGINTYFNKDDNKALLFGGLQRDYCQNFYKYVRNQIVEEKQNDLPVLLDMLKLVFGYYVSFMDYELIEPEIGMESNSEHSIICSQKMTGGIVSDVLLWGYKDKEGNVQQTALVKVQ